MILTIIVVCNVYHDFRIENDQKIKYSGHSIVIFLVKRISLDELPMSNLNSPGSIIHIFCIGLRLCLERVLLVLFDRGANQSSQTP